MTRSSLFLFRHRSARWTVRYWILRAIYTSCGLIDVPLIGPRGDGRRDCSPGFQAQADVFGVITTNGDKSVCGRGIRLNGWTRFRDNRPW